MSGHPRRWSLVAGALVAVLAGALALLGDRASGGSPTLSLRSKGTFSSPIYVTYAPGAGGFLYVVEQGGTIRVIDHGTVKRQPFLNIQNRVLSGGEQGLLSMAFDPRYRSNHLFYAAYTKADGALEVDEFHAASNTRGNKNSRRRVIVVPHPDAGNHNGGQLQFGPDGYLYIGMGDGGSANDPGNRAQTLSDPLGKILRIDVDNGDPYSSPASNPFLTRTGARPEIWAYGLRNPWRFSFDRATNDLWIADVGQGAWEEIDFQPSTSIGGENYGWRRMEGTHCFNPGAGCNDGSLVLPVIEYDHSNGACSVTGGYVYRGSVSPRLYGTYVYGDYCNGVIWGATRAGNGTVTSTVLANTTLSISTFGEDLNGEIYVTDYGNGRLYHLVDPRPAIPNVRRRSVRH